MSCKVVVGETSFRLARTFASKRFLFLREDARVARLRLDGSEPEVVARLEGNDFSNSSFAVARAHERVLFVHGARLFELAPQGLATRRIDLSAIIPEGYETNWELSVDDTLSNLLVTCLPNVDGPEIAVLKYDIATAAVSPLRLPIPDHGAYALDAGRQRVVTLSRHASGQELVVESWLAPRRVLRLDRDYENVQLSPDNNAALLSSFADERAEIALVLLDARDGAPTREMRLPVLGRCAYWVGRDKVTFEADRRIFLCDIGASSVIPLFNFEVATLDLGWSGGACSDPAGSLLAWPYSIAQSSRQVSGTLLFDLINHTYRDLGSCWSRMVFL